MRGVPVEKWLQIKPEEVSKPGSIMRRASRRGASRKVDGEIRYFLQFPGKLGSSGAFNRVQLKAHCASLKS
jgi:hypothetical protein